MDILYRIVLLVVLGGLFGFPAAAQVPDLDDISGEWKPREWLGIQPSIRNFHGTGLTNDDLVSFSWFVSAPFSQGYHSGTLRVNGAVPLADAFRWFPYQVLRKAQYGSLQFESSTRMVPEANGVLWRVRVENTGTEPAPLDLSLDAIAVLSKYTGEKEWQWWYLFPTVHGKGLSEHDRVQPVQRMARMEELERVRSSMYLPDSLYPADTPTRDQILSFDQYTATTEEGGALLLVRDTQTEARTAFAFHTRPDRLVPGRSGGTAGWNRTLAPGETFVIEYVMAFGDDEAQVRADARRWAEGFGVTFEAVEATWRTRWQQLFEPGNPLVSGNIPVLETADEAVRRVYYTGPLTALYMMNTGLPHAERVYLTGGPRWGASIMFYWDTTEWHTLGMLLDPEQMREHLLSWLRIDIDKYYGRDYYRGDGVGNGYVANYWAIFQMLNSYVTVTGDYRLLDEKIDGRSVLERMEAMAYNWKRLSKEGQPGYEGEQYRLADFGDDPWNLLEAVPTYIHIVPSFNAGYVWMMRTVADYHRQRGNEQKARALQADGDAMAKRVLNLYAGNGYWHALFPGNRRVELRHVLDFSYVSRYLHQDLTPQMENEMIAFLERELLTDTWMRAQSLDDPAAANSDRPDHGPLGAYDGWPADVVESLASLGHYDRAMAMFRRVEPVTREGGWAQSHEIFGPMRTTKHGNARIAGRGWHVRDASCGISFTSNFIRAFFGFIPGVKPGDMLRQPDVARGFAGTLRHVRYQGKWYTITSTPDGLTANEETP